MPASARFGIGIEEVGHCVLEYNKYLAPCSYRLIIIQTDRTNFKVDRDRIYGFLIKGQIAKR